MKAILLAGGKGTRLRPLTIHTPKPIVPIFNRPFLHYQLDLLKQVPEIDEVILSLNYQPRRIEEVFGDGGGTGGGGRDVAAPRPAGTAGVGVAPARAPAGASATSLGRPRSAPAARSATPRRASTTRSSSSTAT